ncbi:MAG: hypothetical protein ABL879_12280 [Devosia sp.]
MPFRSRTLVREFSTALAVVAVYILVLLAPLHQAAGLQKDLAGLGYESTATWSLCVAVTPADSSGKSAADIKCPAASIGKDGLVPVEPSVIDLAIQRSGEPLAYFAVATAAVSNVSPHIAEARAPPATA